MNWYKVANKFPIQMTTYSANLEGGRITIFFEGKGPYYYYGVSPFLYNKIKGLLYYKNYPTVSKILKRLSDSKKENNNSQTEFDF